MKISRAIFKAYDIRGLLDTELSDDLAYHLGRAFVTWRARELGKNRLVIAVGRDMRESSIGLQAALMQGLVDSGAQVKDLGLVSTPAFYFGVSHTGADGGIMVSASHNPAEYNGFKLTRERAIPVSGETGIMELADLIEAETYAERLPGGSIEAIAGIPQADVDAQMAYAGADPVSPFKIVADAANGMGAQYLDALFSKLPVSPERLFWELDGSFPNHEANPLKDETLDTLKARVKETRADLGIATDGDGDRIFFVDETGETVPPHVVRGLLARIMLRRFPGATICYDVRPGKITEDMIRDSGGVASLARVGHSLIKEQMAREGAVFGGESSGHFFYTFETGIYEGPVTVAVQVLQELTRSGQTFSEFIAPLKRYVHSGELNFHVHDKAQAMARIKEAFNSGELLELDGVSITYPEFWFNVRASNTESVLRLNLEAVDQNTMEHKRDEIIRLLEKE